MNMFWEIILSNAVVAGVMAIAAALIGRLWKNPAAVHVLWLAVLIKLFTPPLATLSWPLEPATPPATRSADHHPTNEGSLHLTAAGGRVEPTIAEGPAPSVSIQPADLNRRSASAASFLSQLQPTTALSALWLTGSACLALAYCLRIRRFVKLMRGFTPASEETQSLVSELSTRLGLRRVPEVLTTVHTLPPLVWSMGGRPRLVLPSRLFDGLAEEARASILLHELAHVRRRDHLVRLLELAATVGFWWHPVVWWSRRRLRDLEEECCDAIVLEAAPSQARTYALALLETLDFLSRTPRLGVPLPTAVHSTDSLTRRIRMLAQSRPARLRPFSAALVAGLVALPLAVAFSAEPRPAPDDAPAAKPAVIVGEVKDKAGEPLADALVLAVHPFIELRLEAPDRSSKRYETRTDAAGRYRLEISGQDAATTVAVEVRKPGYRRSTGMLGKLPIDDRKVEIKPGSESSASFVLESSLYFKGVAVDGEGQPMARASVVGLILWGHSSGSVESTATNDDGSFELFNYPASARFSEEQSNPGRAEVRFAHPDYNDAVISDLYQTPEDGRRLRIVMQKGAALSGKVLNAAGAPVAGVAVRAQSLAPGPWNQKQTITDDQGRYILKGLVKAKNKLRVLSMSLEQMTTIEKVVEGDETGFTIRLEPMNLPTSSKTYDVLGMRMTDVTPEYRRAYDLPLSQGALVLDPGADSERLGVPRLTKTMGYFLLVDGGVVFSVRGFIDRLIAGAESPEGRENGISVSYNYTGDQEGSRGTKVKLTRADLDRLKAVLKTME